MSTSGMNKFPRLTFSWNPWSQVKPRRSPAPRRPKDLFSRDCRAAESLSCSHASLRLRGGDVPPGPVPVLPGGAAARGVGAGERLRPAAAQLLGRPFGEAEGHNQSRHLPSSQSEVIQEMWRHTAADVCLFGFTCSDLFLRWESVGSPHRLAWFWLQVLEKWTEEKVDLKTLVYKTKKEWRSLKN